MRALPKILLWYVVGFVLFGIAATIVGDFALLLLALALAFFGYRRFRSKKQSENRTSKGSIVLLLFSAFFLLGFLAVISGPDTPTQLASNDSAQEKTLSTNETSQAQAPTAEASVTASTTSDKTNDQFDQTAEVTTAAQPLSKETADTPESNRIPVTFVEGTDGDTFKVSLDGKEEKVRLLLVDTPESVKPDTPVQPFAKEASDFTLNQLKKGNLTLELDVSERDKYGRLLAYAWIGDKMLNEMLLEEGYARVAYIYPPNVKYVDQFKEIQAKAQKSSVGIWSIENYAQEDGFNVAVADSSASEKKETTTKKTDTSSSTTKTTTSTPKKETVSKPDPKPETVVYYKNCDAVRAAGADPIYEGEPGYSRKLDRDGDGIGCER